MANPHRGEIDFAADGTIYTLRYSANAICELEGLLDRSIVSISGEMQQWAAEPDKIRMRLIRAVFWAGLSDKHPNITVKEAGELVIAAGGILKVLDLISRGFAAAFPPPEEDYEKKENGSHPTKGDGTGKVFSATG